MLQIYNALQGTDKYNNKEATTFLSYNLVIEIGSRRKTGNVNFRHKPALPRLEPELLACFVFR